MSEPRHLSPDEISKLLAKPPTKVKAKRKKSGRDYEDRTTSGWFKLWHHWDHCQVPDHDAEYDKPHPVNPELHGIGRMCAQITNKQICRYCYLQSKDIAAWGNDYWIAE